MTYEPPLQVCDLGLELLACFCFHVPTRYVLYHFDSVAELETVQRFLRVPVGWRDVHKHQGLRIPAKRVLHQVGQLIVQVWDVRPRQLFVRKAGDDVAKIFQGEVDGV